MNLRGSLSGIDLSGLGMTDAECCAASEREVNDPTWGGTTACCNGRRIVCVYSNNKTPWKRQSTIAHESVHVADENALESVHGATLCPAQGYKAAAFEGEWGTNEAHQRRAASECRAYTAQINSIYSMLPSVTDPETRDKMIQVAQIIDKGMRWSRPQFCREGGVSLPPILALPTVNAPVAQPAPPARSNRPVIETGGSASTITMPPITLPTTSPARTEEEVQATLATHDPNYSGDYFQNILSSAFVPKDSTEQDLINAIKAKQPTGTSGLLGGLSATKKAVKAKPKAAPTPSGPATHASSINASQVATVVAPVVLGVGTYAATRNPIAALTVAVVTIGAILGYQYISKGADKVKVLPDGSIISY